MDDIRERLLSRDYLYGDAEAYRAGVEAALAAVAGAQASGGAGLQPPGDRQDRVAGVAR